jgi:hypothetical protein
VDAAAACRRRRFVDCAAFLFQIWDYICVMEHIDRLAQEQPAAMTYVEKYIYGLMLRKDVTWFPQNKVNRLCRG